MILIPPAFSGGFFLPPLLPCNPFHLFIIRVGSLSQMKNVEQHSAPIEQVAKGCKLQSRQERRWRIQNICQSLNQIWDFGYYTGNLNPFFLHARNII